MLDFLDTLPEERDFDAEEYQHWLDSLEEQRMMDEAIEKEMACR